MTTVRPPAVAGQFYPGDPATLRETVSACLSAGRSAEAASSGTIIGCVVPHAGYVYSGPTAGQTYLSIAGSNAKTVVLVGPSHRDSFASVAVYNGDAYATPLGQMPVDTDLSRKLAEASSVIRLSDIGHRAEHALEVQIPFLQTVLPRVRIVPVTMGSQARDACEALADALAAVLRGADALLIASSDLSHFHPYDEANRIDQETARLIAAFDDDGLMRALETERVEACGGGPVVAVMKASRALGATTSRVLHTCNSGDVAGDRTSVVGYLSAVFGRPAV